MQVKVVNGHLEVVSSETDAARQKRERLALPYAVMRSGLHGGHGTRLTAIDKQRTKVEPANGKLTDVKDAMDIDYQAAMERFVVLYGREVDAWGDLP